MKVFEEDTVNAKRCVIRKRIPEIHIGTAF